MIEKIVESLLQAQVRQGTLSDETVPVYRYGYTVLIEISINFLLALLVGVLMREIGIVLLFSLLFVPLRSFCGGWHAEKSWLCVLVSLGVLILSLFVGKFQLLQFGTYVWIAAMAAACVVILRYAPIDSEAKRLSAHEIRRYKMVIRIIVTLEIACFIILLCAHIYKYAGVISTVIYIQSCSLIISLKGKRKRRKQNE